MFSFSMNWLFPLLTVICFIWLRTFYYRPKDVKKTKKSKVLASTTTYSSRSMSCCTACGGLSCRSGHSVGAKQATLKSMTICHSLDDLDLSFAESEVLQPQNSTLREDALSLELKDIFPQDLSAILGKLFKMYLFVYSDIEDCSSCCIHQRCPRDKFFFSWLNLFL